MTMTLEQAKATRDLWWPHLTSELEVAQWVIIAELQARVAELEARGKEDK